jgi:hypothetical protein
VRTTVATLALAALAASAGCSTADTADTADTASSAESLWAARSPYVGDNSRVASLVEALDVGGSGGYDLELQTARAPFGLTVTVREPEKPFADTDHTGDATLLLGLVANLDEVTIAAGRDDFSLSTDAASQELGYDVKQLGRDRAALEHYLEQAAD